MRRRHSAARPVVSRKKTRFLRETQTVWFETTAFQTERAHDRSVKKFSQKEYYENFYASAQPAATHLRRLTSCARGRRSALSPAAKESPGDEATRLEAGFAPSAQAKRWRALPMRSSIRLSERPDFSWKRRISLSGEYRGQSVPKRRRSRGKWASSALSSSGEA